MENCTSVLVCVFWSVCLLGVQDIGECIALSVQLGQCVWLIAACGLACQFELYDMGGVSGWVLDCSSVAS